VAKQFATNSIKKINEIFTFLTQVYTKTNVSFKEIGEQNNWSILREVDLFFKEFNQKNDQSIDFCCLYELIQLLNEREASSATKKDKNSEIIDKLKT